jgi:hypothetical protein
MIERPAALTEHRRRPASIVMASALLAVLRLSAIGGGIELTFGVGAARDYPADWPDRLPVVNSWVLPGLVLGFVFGVVRW